MTVESDGVTPRAARPLRTTYPPAGALAGIEMPTSQVSAAPGASTTGAEPITTDHPFGTESAGSACTVSDAGFFTAKTAVTTVPASACVTAAEVARSSSAPSCARTAAAVATNAK